MSTTDHWFRFNIGDYLADTMDFTPFQHGIYVLLLLHAYRHDGRLPTDMPSLRRIARVSRSSSAQINTLMETLFVRSDQAYLHRRVIQELERAKVASSMGKHAAAHRWSKGNGHADRNADRNANQEPELEPEDSPPRGPPSQGGRARRAESSRNAFADIIAETMAARRREEH